MEKVHEKILYLTIEHIHRTLDREKGRKRSYYFKIKRRKKKKIKTTTQYMQEAFNKRLKANCVTKLTTTTFSYA